MAHGTHLGAVRVEGDDGVCEVEEHGDEQLRRQRLDGVAREGRVVGVVPRVGVLEHAQEGELEETAEH